MTATATVVNETEMALRRELAQVKQQLAERDKQLEACQTRVKQLTERNRQILQKQKGVETMMRAPSGPVSDRAKLVGLRQLEYIRKAQAKGEVAKDGSVLVPTWDISRELGGIDRKSIGRAIKSLDEDLHLWKQETRWDYLPWDKNRDGTPKPGAEKTQLSYVLPNPDLTNNLQKLGTDPTTPVRNHGGPRTVSMRAPVPETCPACHGHLFEASLVLKCVTPGCGTILVHDTKPIDTREEQDEPEPEMEQDRDEEMVAPIEPAPNTEEWARTIAFDYCEMSDTRHHEQAAMRTPDGRYTCVHCGKVLPREEVSA